MMSWEYERWDHETRALYYYDPTPSSDQLGDEPDIRDVIIGTVQHMIMRLLFPRGFPRL